MRSSILTVTVGLCFVLLGTTACSSTFAAQSVSAATVSSTTTGGDTQPSDSSTSNPSTSNPSAANSSAAPPAGGSVEDGLGHPVKICALMPPAAAAKVSAIAIVTAKEEDTPSYKLYSCNYTNAAGTDGFVVSVLGLDAAAGYDGNVSTAGSGSHPFAGLGDKAFSSVLGLEALFGNVSVTVSGLASNATAEAIIRALKPKL